MLLKLASNQDSQDHSKVCLKVKVAQSSLTFCGPMDCSPWNSPGLSLLQGIFPTQGSNPGLSHCRQILYQLSRQGFLRACRQTWMLGLYPPPLGCLKPFF